MCGICGFTGTLENREDVLKRMTEVITHRGPDSDGYYCDDAIAMGFRRLSIIDLESGHQPIYNEGKTLVLTFNGEIYNYKQLKQELISKGHRFATESDSEVLVHGFEEWKEDLLPRLRGMFAFAIYNTADKSVFVARDPFGIKPLHYTQIGNDFVYASEIKSILEHPKFEKRFNRRALDTYLSYQYALPPETFFEEVYCLLPGHYLWFQNGAVETFRYFEPRFRPNDKLTEEEAVEQIEKVFEDSVNAHKIADVEVGCFLSSGVDSSYVSTYFSGQKTFTVGFDFGEHYNEISWAESLSKLIDVEHHTHLISGAEFWDAVPTVQYYMDQPLADPSCVALYFVSRLASQYVKVVLSGEGADELFGGYTCYNDPRVFKIYQTIVPHFLRKALRAIARKLPDIKGRDYIIRACDKLEDRYIGNAFMYDLKEKQKILKEPAIATAPQRYARKHYYRARRYDDVTKMQYLDINLWMTGDILLKADRMSMANSLELRVPFLDKEVFKVASTLPTELRVNKYNTKYALRKAAAKHMPESTAEKEKLGFPVPTRVWLREEKYYNIVKERFESATAEKFFHTDELMKWLDQHFSGKEDNSRRIWTVYVFLVWYDIYFNENNPHADKPVNHLDELKAAAEAAREKKLNAPGEAIIKAAEETGEYEAPDESSDEAPAEEATAEEAPKSMLDLIPALETVAVPAAQENDEITEDVFDEDLPEDVEEEESGTDKAADETDDDWESAFEEPLPEDEEILDGETGEGTSGEQEDVAEEAVDDENNENGEFFDGVDDEEYYDEEADGEEYYDEEADGEEFYDEETDGEEFYDEEAGGEEFYDEEAGAEEFYDEEADGEEFYDEEADGEEFYDEETEGEEFYDEEADGEEFYDEEADGEEFYDEEADGEEFYDENDAEDEEFYDEPESYRDGDDDDLDQYKDVTDEEEDEDGEGYWDDDLDLTKYDGDNDIFDDLDLGNYQRDKDVDPDKYDGVSEEQAEDETDDEPVAQTWENSFKDIVPEIYEEDGEEFIDISVYSTGKSKKKSEPLPAFESTEFDDAPQMPRRVKPEQPAAADEPADDATAQTPDLPEEALPDVAGEEPDPFEDNMDFEGNEPEIPEEAPQTPASPQEQMQLAPDAIEKRTKELGEPNVMSDESVSQIRFFGDEEDEA